MAPHARTRRGGRRRRRLRRCAPPHWLVAMIAQTAATLVILAVAHALGMALPAAGR